MEVITLSHLDGDYIIQFISNEIIKKLIQYFQLQKTKQQWLISNAGIQFFFTCSIMLR